MLDGPDRAPNRSMLRAVGFNDADFAKPQVGIASVWFEGNPCNMHLLDLAAKVSGDEAQSGMSRPCVPAPGALSSRTSRPITGHHA